MAGEVQFPQHGYVRLAQLIGQRQVTEDEARRNRRRGKGPRRAREGSPGILPASRSTVWNWVKRGRIPAPVYPFGEKIPCWSADTIRKILEPRVLNHSAAISKSEQRLAERPGAAQANKTPSKLLTDSGDVLLTESGDNIALEAGRA